MEYAVIVVSGVFISNLVIGISLVLWDILTRAESKRQTAEYLKSTEELTKTILRDSQASR